MSKISVPQFLEATIRWAQNENNRFKYYWPVKGGWEGWIQVDLAAYLLSIDATVEILREQPIFSNRRQRVDLLLNVDQATDDQIAVEIKAESFSNRIDPFVFGTRDDLRKLSEDRIADFSESPCVMLALPFNQESLNAILGIRDHRDRVIFGTIFMGEVAVCASVYEEAEGWHPPVQTDTIRDTLPPQAEVIARGFR